MKDLNERVRGRSERVSLREMFRDEMRVNERERGVYYFNHRLIKIIIIIIIIIALMNSAHLFLDVYCSSGAKKKKRFSSTAEACFL